MMTQRRERAKEGCPVSAPAKPNGKKKARLVRDSCFYTYKVSASGERADVLFRQVHNPECKTLGKLAKFWLQMPWSVRSASRQGHCFCKPAVAKCRNRPEPLRRPDIEGGNVVDVVPPKVRSKMMASIRGRDTKPEMLVRRHLHRQGFRYRLSPKDIIGRPDLVLRRFGAVVLVHGCFWHGHARCRYATVPSTNVETWEAKLVGNRLRDARVISDLLWQGWRVAVIWECSLKSRPEIALESLERFIVSNRRSLEIPSSPHFRRNE